MGVEGLWEIIKPLGETYKLDNLVATNYGYSVNGPKRVPIIGVDISIVMNECVAGERKRHIYQYKSGGPLLTFFFKLCKFARIAPVIMVFLFDGPDRPQFKRGKEINRVAIPEWVEPCKRIIEAFGFYWHQAPGEADAELAMLNRTNAIDYILTSDADTFVFGGKHVLRPATKPHGGSYELYNANRFSNTLPDVKLTQGGMILMALLSGGDYFEGLSGCGPVIAASLACCGFGDQLLQAVLLLSGSDLTIEIQNIVSSIQTELTSNKRGYLTARHPALAKNLVVGHLAPERIEMYLKPVVSASFRPQWIHREPIIMQITDFCIHTFGWASNMVEKKVGNVLWPGVFLRMITSPMFMYSRTQQTGMTPNNHTKVISIKIRARKSLPGQWATIKFSTQNFISLLALRLGDQSGPHVSQAVSQPTLKVWIRAEFIPEVLSPIAPRPRNREMPPPTYGNSIIERIDAENIISSNNTPRPEPSNSTLTPQRSSKRTHTAAFPLDDVDERETIIISD